MILHTVKPGDWASRPEKSAAKMPALSNWPEPIRLSERLCQYAVAIVDGASSRDEDGHAGRGNQSEGVNVPRVDIACSREKMLVRGVLETWMRSDVMLTLPNC